MTMLPEMAWDWLEPDEMQTIGQDTCRRINALTMLDDAASSFRAEASIRAVFSAHPAILAAVEARCAAAREAFDARPV